MKAGIFAGMLTALAIPAVAEASIEAPSTPAELARDREIIRELNLRQLDFVRQRDADEARRQEASRDAQMDYQIAYDDYARQRAEYLRRRNDYEGSMDRFALERRDYEARLVN